MLCTVLYVPKKVHMKRTKLRREILENEIWRNLLWLDRKTFNAGTTTSGDRWWFIRMGVPTNGYHGVSGIWLWLWMMLRTNIMRCFLSIWKAPPQVFKAGS